MKKIPRKARTAAEPAPMYGEARVKIADFKAHLSRYLRTIRAGGALTILDRATPVARVIPVPVGGPRMEIELATKRPDEVHLPPPLKLDVDPLRILREIRRDRV